jgi:hypothetical protein
MDRRPAAPKGVASTRERISSAVGNASPPCARERATLRMGQWELPGPVAPQRWLLPRESAASQSKVWMKLNSTWPLIFSFKARISACTNHSPRFPRCARFHSGALATSLEIVVGRRSTSKSLPYPVMTTISGFEALGGCAMAENTGSMLVGLVVIILAGVCSSPGHKRCGRRITSRPELLSAKTGPPHQCKCPLLAQSGHWRGSHISKRVAGRTTEQVRRRRPTMPAHK